MDFFGEKFNKKEINEEKDKTVAYNTEDRKKWYQKYRKKHKTLLATFSSVCCLLLVLAIILVAFQEVRILENNKSIKKTNEVSAQLQSVNSELVSENAEYRSKIEVYNKKAAGEELDNSDKTVYLTFDDGPSKNTPEILEILKRYGVKATFFVKNSGKYNKYMKDITDAGHTIALHTYSHNYSKIYKSVDAYFEDLQKISDLVKKETGVETKIARFPGGTSNTVSKRYCDGIMTKLKKQTAEKGYYYFDWNVDSYDATGNNVPVNKLIAGATAGRYYKNDTLIVLMHDTNMKDTTVDALPGIIEAYQHENIKFSAINELTKPIVFKTNN